jgi:hypothetical protein
MSTSDVTPITPAPNTLSPAAETTVHNCAEPCKSTPISLPTLPPPPSTLHPPLPARNSTLSPRQLTALNLLVMGKPVSIVAHTLGVHRNTVSHWRSRNPHFVAELHRRQQDIIETTLSKIRRLLIVSVNEIESALKRNYFTDAAKIAFRFLGAAGAFPRGAADPGPTDPALLLDRMLQSDAALDQQRRQLLDSLLARYQDDDHSPSPAPSEVSSPHPTLNPESRTLNPAAPEQPT